MKKNNIIKDPEYIEWVEKQPCYFCGYIPKGLRSIFIESEYRYYKKPTKNTAHHIGDGDTTRTKNDHLVLPACSHYVVSGDGTKDCHSIEHTNKEAKNKERNKQLRIAAHNYYEFYCIQKEYYKENEVNDE